MGTHLLCYWQVCVPQSDNFSDTRSKPIACSMVSALHYESAPYKACTQVMVATFAPLASVFLRPHCPTCRQAPQFCRFRFAWAISWILCASFLAIRERLYHFSAKLGIREYLMVWMYHNAGLRWLGSLGSNGLSACIGHIGSFQGGLRRCGWNLANGGSCGDCWAALASESLGFHGFCIRNPSCFRPSYRAWLSTKGELRGQSF